jgi:hypothetical protein
LLLSFVTLYTVPFAVSRRWVGAGAQNVVRLRIDLKDYADFAEIARA